MRYLAPALLVALLSSSALAQTAPAAPVVPSASAAAPVSAQPMDDYVILKVNSSDIKASEMERIWRGALQGQEAPDFSSVDEKIRQNVMRGAITERLLLEEATKQGVDQSEAVARDLEELKKKVVVKHFLDSKTAGVVKDADIKREYDALVARVKDEMEVRARHILVATEKEAQDIKARIDKGEAFEKIAAEASKDPGSARQGGDLGYFTKGKMVKQFAEAAFKLGKGEISSPVRTPFGYHIIKVEDKRKLAPPTFSDVQEQLRMGLQEKALNAYLKTLMERSSVKYFDAAGKEKAFEKLPKEEAAR